MIKITKKEQYPIAYFMSEVLVNMIEVKMKKLIIEQLNDKIYHLIFDNVDWPRKILIEKEKIIDTLMKMNIKEFNNFYKQKFISCWQNIENMSEFAVQMIKNFKERQNT